MSGTIYKAAAGAMMMQHRLDMLSNNLANMNTVGFKADRPEFRVPMDKVDPQAEANPAQISPYAPPFAYHVDFSAGEIKQTHNSLDVAIVGNGFFEIQTDGGPQYTRKGNFSINNEGLLATADGLPVMGQGGVINIDGVRIEIGSQGEIFMDGTLVDSLKIVDFEKPYALQKVGGNHFVPLENNARTVPAEAYSTSQGFVEYSNVNAIRTMTDVIETSRAFESYQKIISAADDAMGKTVNEVARKA